MRNSTLLCKLKLCLVTDISNINSYTPFLRKVAKAGVTMVQLREKGSDIQEFINRAIVIKEVLQPFNIPLIINDNVLLAKELGLGVHIGQNDMDPIKARDMLGSQSIIGLTVESMQELSQANNLPVDYLGLSSVFKSKRKNCKTIWGLSGLEQACVSSKHPIIGIGGINQANASQVLRAGACGIAVIGAVQDAENPVKATKDLLEICESSIINQPRCSL